MQPAISVIVPVYKAEKYLHRCVDSILAQTFTDFEVLLIDDGSPDGSGAICDEYAAKDSRVRVFHKENGGVSAARQMGIDNARGEYTIHADPDDYVEPTMLEEQYRKAKEEDADMVICDYYVNMGGRQRYVKQQPSALDGATVQRELFQQLHGSCCNKLVRRVCYSAHCVRYPEGINYCEDLIFNVRLMKFRPKITYLPRAFYHYVQGENEQQLSRNRSLECQFQVMALAADELGVSAYLDVLPYFSYGVAKHILLSQFRQHHFFRPFTRETAVYPLLAWRATKRSLLLRLVMLPYGVMN